MALNKSKRFKYPKKKTYSNMTSYINNTYNKLHSKATEVNEVNEVLKKIHNYIDDQYNLKKEPKIEALNAYRFSSFYEIIYTIELKNLNYEKIIFRIFFKKNSFKTEHYINVSMLVDKLKETVRHENIIEVINKTLKEQK